MDASEGLFPLALNILVTTAFWSSADIGWLKASTNGLYIVHACPFRLTILAIASHPRVFILFRRRFALRFRLLLTIVVEGKGEAEDIIESSLSAKYSNK